MFNKKKLFLFLFPLTFLCIIVILVSAGFFSAHDRDYYLANPDYFCIAADSQENIYIGSIGQIKVISKNGEEVREIPIDSLKGFRFNIVDDKIYMDTVPKNYVTDLYGNELDIPLTKEENSNIQQRSVSSFTAKDGTEYSLLNNRVFRQKNGTSVQIYPKPKQSGSLISPTVQHHKEGII